MVKINQTSLSETLKIYSFLVSFNIQKFDKETSSLSQKVISFDLKNIVKWLYLYDNKQLEKIDFSLGFPLSSTEKFNLVLKLLYRPVDGNSIKKLFTRSLKSPEQKQTFLKSFLNFQKKI